MAFPSGTEPARPSSGDAECMARLARGDDLALDELMDRHGGALRGYLARVLLDDTVADELAEETFVRLYQSCQRFRAGAAFVPWLYTIATNLARDRQRWRSRRPEISLQHTPPGAQALHDTLPDPRPSPADKLVRAERAAQVRQALANLPEDLRTPLALAEYEDLRVADIAEVLGCSAKAVEMRLYRARQELRKALRSLLPGEGG